MDTILLSVTSKMLNLRLFIFHATVNDSKNNSVNPSWCAGTLTLFIYCGLPQKRSAAVHIYFQINLMVEREGMAAARSK